MQVQTLATVPVKISKQDVVLSLSNQQENAHAMKAPYTVLVKKLTESYYLWVVYSWPRPYNAIWGDVVVRTINGPKTEIRVNYGCSWQDNLPIVHSILKYRKREGFVVVSSLFKDKSSYRILGNLIKSAYETGADVEYPDMFHEKGEMVVISNQEINDQIVKRMYDRAEFDETNELIEEISQEMAGEYLTHPNLYQYVPNSSSVPQNVIDSIHEFLEHSTATNEDISKKCQLYLKCKHDEISGIIDPSCDLYKPGWRDKAEEGDLL